MAENNQRMDACPNPRLVVSRRYCGKKEMILAVAKTVMLAVFWSKYRLTTISR